MEMLNALILQNSCVDDKVISQSLDLSKSLADVHAVRQFKRKQLQNVGLGGWGSDVPIIVQWALHYTTL